MLAFLLLACQTPGGDQPCTDIAVLSLRVDVVDLDGAPLSGAVVTYAVDGGAPVEATCLDDACTSFATAYETIGTFDVSVTYEADTSDPCCWYTDSATASATIGLTDDGCHPEQQTLTIALDAEQMVCADCG
jgi:hypothetical protein